MISLFERRAVPAEVSEPLSAQVASTIITARHIKKRFRAKKELVTALDDCSIEVLENEFVCIVGTSGCGKSTLLRMLAGLDFPTEGDIVIKDRRVEGPAPDRGMVFQTYTLFPWLSVKDNIAYGLREQGADQDTIKKTVRKYLALMRLDSFADAYPKELSGGMKQRVAIARALATKPELLLMDEPFGALDPITKSEMQQLIREIWQKERPTIAFVTHDIEEAVFLSTKIYVMSAHPGRVKECIPVYLPYQRTQELKEREDFVALRMKINDMLDQQELPVA